MKQPVEIEICMQTKAFSQPKRSNQLVQGHISRGCVAKLGRSPLHNFSISRFDRNFFWNKTWFCDACVRPRTKSCFKKLIDTLPGTTYYLGLHYFVDSWGCVIIRVEPGAYMWNNHQNQDMSANQGFFSTKEVQPVGSTSFQSRLCSKIRSITITPFLILRYLQ